MTDQSPPPFQGARQWVDLWFETQQQYWNSWLDVSRRLYGLEPDTARAEPAKRSADWWSSVMLPMAPSQFHDWTRSLAEANTFYLRWSENVWRGLAGTYQTAQGAGNPWEAFSRKLKVLQEDFTENLRAGRNPWAGLATLWGMPLDNWRRVCSAFSVMPGDMEKAARELGSPYGPESLHRTMVGLLSMPTVGYTREWQEELQQWGLLWIEHAEALREFGIVLVTVALRAFELFGKALSQKAVENEPMGGLREFYNQWVDCAEEAYSEISVTSEFVNAQARLTNTLFAIKRQEQKMVEEIQSALNMPTRRELDTSHRRLHELERRLWQLEQALGELNGASLSALRQQVEALRASYEAGEAKPPSSRKSNALKTPS